MRCENKINMWILQIISQQMCFFLRVLRRTTGFFISRANAPRVLREILFLVQNTLDCYEKFFSRAKHPWLLREIFFLVQNTLDCYEKFFFSCKTPLSVTGNFFSRAKHPWVKRMWVNMGNHRSHRHWNSTSGTHKKWAAKGFAQSKGSNILQAVFFLLHLQCFFARRARPMPPRWAKTASQRAEIST